MEPEENRSKLRVSVHLDQIDRKQFGNTLIRFTLTNDEPFPIHIKSLQLKRVASSKPMPIGIGAQYFRHIERDQQKMIVQDFSIIPSFILSTGSSYKNAISINSLMEHIESEGLEEALFHVIFECAIDTSPSSFLIISLHIKKDALWWHQWGGLFSWKLYIQESEVKKILEIRKTEYKCAVWCGSIQDSVPISVKDRTFPLTNEQMEQLTKLEDLATRSNDDIQMILRAAVEGVAEAMLFVGVHFWKDWEFPRDVKEGEIWLRKAVLIGTPAHMHLLGTFLSRKESSPEDKEEGKRLIDKSKYQFRIKEEEDHSWNVWNRGMDLVKSGDIEEGKKWLHKAAEMNSGHRWCLGDLLLKGILLSQDQEEGEKCLFEAAEAGNPACMWDLGEYLLKGELLTQNKEEGLKWLRKVAEEREYYMRSLAKHLLKGEFLSQDIEEGGYWLQRAEEVER